MAYVGTPKYLGSDQATIASILYGEAGNQGPAGMQAVFNVLENRASSNFGDYGSDLLSQALAPNQFQGQATPTQTSLNIAARGLNGELTDITGGAIYYANPTASSATWATNLSNNNALQIGDHYFTDNMNGNPFNAGTVLNSQSPLQTTSTDAPINASVSYDPNYLDQSTGGATLQTTDVSNLGYGADAQAAGQAYTYPYATTDLQNQTAQPGTIGEDLSSQGFDQQNIDSVTASEWSQSPYSGDQISADNSVSASDYGQGPNTAQVDSSLITQSSPDFSSGADTTYNSATDPTGAQTSADPKDDTVPQAIDAQTKAAAKDTTAADTTLAGAASSLAKTDTATANATNKTNQGLVASIETWGGNIFVRIGCIALGIVFVIGALYMLAPKGMLPGLPKPA